MKATVAVAFFRFSFLLIAFFRPLQKSEVNSKPPQYFYSDFAYNKIEPLKTLMRLIYTDLFMSNWEKISVNQSHQCFQWFYLVIYGMAVISKKTH
jgi:hypothetical protein